MDVTPRLVFVRRAIVCQKVSPGLGRVSILWMLATDSLQGFKALVYALFLGLSISSTPDEKRCLIIVSIDRPSR